jgi:hypothetical protein
MLTTHDNYRVEERTDERRDETAPLLKVCSNDIRQLVSGRFYAVLQRMFGRRPFRCRNCRVQFYRRAQAVLPRR